MVYTCGTGRPRKATAAEDKRSTCCKDPETAVGDISNDLHRAGEKKPTVSRRLHEQSTEASEATEQEGQAGT